MGELAYQNILHQDDVLRNEEDVDQECRGNLDRNGFEKKILWRRRVILLTIISMFSITCIMLIISVIHEETNRSDVGYTELVCQDSDRECLEKLCPQGFSWNKELEYCTISQGKILIFPNPFQRVFLYIVWLSFYIF